MDLLVLKSIVNLLVGLLPVVVFLVALIIFDSFKLVKLHQVLYAILFGCLVAVACLFINLALMDVTGLGGRQFARYVAPIVEEILKATYVIYLIRAKRVGFMVDAAIFGFAVGAGFAIVENVYYFKQLDNPNVLLWLIRGFGTAFMHGGMTAIVAIMTKYFGDSRNMRIGIALPGLGVAIAAHSFFNHFLLSPIVMTLMLVIGLPLLIAVVFRVSERRTRQWLGVRFDTDQELLEMINTGKTSESRVGAYFEALRERFPGELVVDMVCMLRLHLELSIRAKGILLMREAGFKEQPEPEIEERLRELKYLEKSIGKTGLRAVAPIFNMSDRDIWQLYMLGQK